MEIQEMQEMVHKHIEKHGGYWKPLSILARLTEEVGELARAINIQYGEKKKMNENDGSGINEEIADILIALTAMSNSLNIDLEKELKLKLEKDVKRNKGVYF